ncbi:MAG: DNA-directed RNA polymerase subunit omega [Lachnospira sp.]|nr:DNA-directed RNA polymerase subunit omega [Lachnospira sp.]
MLHPSYSELMSVINSGVEEGEQPVVSSRYSIVKATAARAKEIIDARTVEERASKLQDKDHGPMLTNAEKRTIKMGTPLIDGTDGVKPLTVAVKELYAGKYTIVSNTDME